MTATTALTFMFYGEFEALHKRLVSDAAIERGHHIIDWNSGNPADVIFVMLYEKDVVSKLRGIALRGKRNSPILVFSVGSVSGHKMREFFHTRKVDDIVPAPEDTKDANLLIEALELNNTRIYHPI